jgi:membrane associated rhomboid family serine protease
MLIVPLEKSIDWRRPPLVTLLLVVINCLVLFAFQGRDDAALEEAVKYYLGSDLPAIEFPAYIRYVTARGRQGELQAWREALVTDEDLAATILFVRMERDEEFMRDLREQRVITREHPHFAQWQTQRDRYETLRRASPSWRYGFIPARHRPLTFVTHMFLHGGFGHLLGNMIFLLIVGLAVEVALGSAVYALLYLGGGLAAVLLFWAIYPQSSVPLIGASGAIAGLMGLYAAVFGLRKIRFFYSLLFYFDYVKAPAIVLLPLWLLNEFYQLFWGGASNVAYVAHIGGLAAGGAAGLLLRRAPQRIDMRYLDESAEREKRAEAFEKGLRLLASLQVDKAKSVFRALQAAHPDDREVLVQLYKVEKLNPSTPEFQDVARKVMALPGHDAATVREVHDAFQDYVAASGGKPRLSPDQLLDLALRFTRARHLETAGQIVQVLLRGKPDLPGLDRALLALANAWRGANNPAKQRQYLDLLARTFPASAPANGRQQAVAE